MRSPYKQSLLRLDLALDATKKAIENTKTAFRWYSNGRSLNIFKEDVLKCLQLLEDFYNK